MSEEHLEHVSGVFEDPTPNAIINLRFALGLTDLASKMHLTENEKSDVVKVILLVSRKLAAVWLHKETFRELQHKLVEQVRIAKPPAPPIRREIRLSQEMFIEFDEFLVQVKSTLDYVVKLPIPIWGPQNWRLRTFANKGEDVIRVLENNAPKDYKLKAKGIIQVLLRPASSWIAGVVDTRNKMNHFLDGGIPIEHFAVYREGDGIDGAIRVPMWSADQTIMEFMDAVWANLFRFCEDFVACFLGFRLPEGFGLARAAVGLEDVEPAWEIALDEQRMEALQRAVERSKRADAKE